MSAGSVSKKSLIQDFKKVQEKVGETVTRRIYRGNGSFSDRAWHKHFHNFRAFVKAATADQDEPEEVAELVDDATQKRETTTLSPRISGSMRTVTPTMAIPIRM